MGHLTPLIQDLSIILITAAVTSLIFKKLKQPIILGYMVAGLLVGPHTHWFPHISDIESIRTWAEIGVIFMLFSLGIDFSLRKLAQMGSTILIAGFFELSAMACMGFVVGYFFLHWTAMQSLFLGSTLCVSSTAIIFKAMDEFRLKSKRFTQLVFGILIVEDLAAVMIIVLLTTLGLSQQFQGMDLLWTAGKLVFYLVWWFVVGLFLIPWALRVIKPLLSEELVLVVSIALCLMMVVAASQAGFSPALGAFIMGAILGETDEKEKIEKILSPVNTLFSAIFFVSVGMLINPEVLWAHPQLIFLFSILIIVGKIYYATTGTLIAGQPVRVAIPVGISLAQIGEFSFIIAGLGMSLKIMDDVFYSTIVAVSALTTFTTPYLIRSRESLSDHIEKLIPAKFQNLLNQYLQFSNLLKASPEWRALIRSYLAKIFINIVIVIAVFLLTSRFLYPLMQMKSDNAIIAEVITLVITLLLASPFLWGIIFSHTRDTDLFDLYLEYFSEQKQRSFAFFRMSLAILLLAALLTQYVSIRFAVVVAILIFSVLSYSLFRFIGPIYIWIEGRFLRQINEGRRDQRRPLPVLAPWDAHLSEYEIHPEAECVGKTLSNLHWRETFGIIIAMIQRGQRHIPAPSRDEMLMPYDRVSVIGTDEQLSEFENYLNTFYFALENDTIKPDNYILDQLLVTESSSFVNRSIKDSGLREKTSGLVVGVERGSRRILNPESNFIIRAGDLLWIVGDSGKLKSLASGH